jgi:hypothetical protein
MESLPDKLRALTDPGIRANPAEQISATTIKEYAPKEGRRGAKEGPGKVVST